MGEEASLAFCQAPKPGECFSQKLYELPLPFSLLVHLCFFCLN